jgi:hypothetical protein
MRVESVVGLGASLVVWALASCSANDSGSAPSTGGSSGDASAGSSGAGASGGSGGAAGSGTGGSGAITVDAGDAQAGAGGQPPAPDPKTCAEAAQQKSYVGCEFWPTVLTNPAWNVFDFAAVVANAGTDPADVTVTRNGTEIATATVPPNGAAPLYLPWVAELKGPESDVCASGTPPTSSVLVDGGAYKLVSTKPVTVYQFNPLEFQGTGGPPGKSWASCPGNQTCPLALLPLGCFSFSNDASLLLPATAMTGSYRVTGINGWTAEGVPSYFSVTATQDATQVTVKLSATGQIAAGTGIAATAPNGLLSLTMDAGDVALLVGAPGDTSDPSGSIVQADKPVQVLSGVSCRQIPTNVKACDHIEESVLPVETLGKHYFVAPPTGPKGQPVGHFVRFYGNVDGTKLTYPAVTPVGAPAQLNAGQVFDMGVVNEAFEVQSDKEFAISTFMQGGAAVDPLSPAGTRKGDPSQSQAVAVEQYRQKYVFIAPTDFEVSYVDVIVPLDANAILDGSALPIAPVPIGTSSYGVSRVQLAGGSVHVIFADKPFGIQVAGYARNTSYHYPGGLALQAIAPPLPPVQ